MPAIRAHGVFLQVILCQTHLCSLSLTLSLKGEGTVRCDLVFPS